MDNTQYSVSCVIPCHNEQGNVENLVRHLIPVFTASLIISDFELVLVNDNSTDSTGLIINRLSDESPHIRSVHRSGSPGFGNAVKEGLRIATKEIIIPVMGDLSDDPDDIIKLVERISQGYDIAYGSRFIKGGVLYGYPRGKLIANRLFNNSLRLMFGIPHRDISNAFKAYRKEVIDEIGVQNLESTGFDLTIEIPLKAHIAGFSSSEVPVRWYDRTEGEAKLKISRNATIYGKRLLKLFIVGNIISLRDLFHAVMRGSKVGIIIAFLLGVCLLALLLSLSGFDNLVHSLSHISPVWFGACVFSIVISFLIRTWRWSVLFRSSGYTVHRDILFKAIMFGWLLNYLIPARIGDISRAVVIKISHEAPFGVSLSTIVVERAFDTCTLAVLLVGLGYISYKPEFFIFEIGAVVITAGLVAILCVTYFGNAYVERLLSTRFPEIAESLNLLKCGLRSLSKNYYALFLSFILSILIWAFELACLFFASQAIHGGIRYDEAAVAGTVSFILQSLPLTPAGLGVHEASISGVLQLYGINGALGTSIALLDHAARGLVIYVLGIICAIHIGFSARGFFRANSGESGENL